MVTRPAHAAPGFLSRRSWPVVVAALALTGLVGSGLSDHGTAPRAAAEPLPRVGGVVAGSPTVPAPVLASDDPTAGPTLSAPASRAAGRSTPSDPAPASALAADGIPTTALTAYRDAAAREALLRPSCGLPWTLLAAIGRVESDHGRFAGAVLHSDGLSTPPVVGIPLDGHGTALITDTDRGRLDGDRVYDRAVGPMQFIPSTWASWGVDGNHDGRRDPFNIRDAAPAAADYLCAAGGVLTTVAGQRQAVLSYNHSDAYVAEVLALEKAYATGQPGVAFPTPGTDPGSGAPPRPTLPPVDPAPRTRPRVSRTGGSGPSSASSSAGSSSAGPSSDAPTSGASTSAPACPSPSAGSTGSTGSTGATGSAGSAVPSSAAPSGSTSGSASGSPSGSAPACPPTSSTAASTKAASTTATTGTASTATAAATAAATASGSTGG